MDVERIIGAAVMVKTLERPEGIDTVASPCEHPHLTGAVDRRDDRSGVQDEGASLGAKIRLSEACQSTGKLIVNRKRTDRPGGQYASG